MLPAMEELWNGMEDSYILCLYYFSFVVGNNGFGIFQLFWLSVEAYCASILVKSYRIQFQFF